MNRTEKEEIIQELNGIFKKAQGGVLIDFQGASVESLTKLRKDLYSSNAKLKVLKNSLAKRAVMGTAFEGIKDQIVHTRALAYSDEDVVSTAKIMTAGAKENENIKLVSGVLVTGDKGDVLDAEGIKELSNLPSREELIGKILFLMNAPITSFVRVLNEVPASFARVLQAVADSKE
ncbi:MAG: 50S ribosomal protein L10 [Deltaproteobacteria bacterium]|nr:50S ribosomal protein L10 [Deltaproteobacteria bacterium]